ncbi:MAG: hypothetical protein HKN23_10645 [Verrucomicrobiales bacterium]|nr:hypothetical protein [Verrucomicrobiales bacterium]
MPITSADVEIEWDFVGAETSTAAESADTFLVYAVRRDLSNIDLSAEIPMLAT